jgi:hypothetical protein
MGNMLENSTECQGGLVAGNLLGQASFLNLLITPLRNMACKLKNWLIGRCALEERIKRRATQMCMKTYETPKQQRDPEQPEGNMLLPASSSACNPFCPLFLYFLSIFMSPTSVPRIIKFCVTLSSPYTLLI